MPRMPPIDPAAPLEVQRATQGKPASRLTNMKLEEVSLCRKGVNPGAVVALFKSADSPIAKSAIALEQGAAVATVAAELTAGLSPSSPVKAAVAKALSDVRQMGDFVDAASMADTWLKLVSAVLMVIRSVIESDLSDSARVTRIEAGVADFTIALEKAAFPPAAPTAPAPVVKSFTEIWQERQAAAAQQSTTTTENTEMPLDLESLRKATNLDDVLRALPEQQAAILRDGIAKATAAARAKATTEPPTPICKSQVWSLMKARAEGARRAGETVEQAVCRLVDEDTTMADLYGAYRNAAPDPAPVQKAAPTSGVPLKTPAFARLEEKAHEIRKAMPELSHEQALDRAVIQNPALYYEHQEQDARLNGR